MNKFGWKLIYITREEHTGKTGMFPLGQSIISATGRFYLLRLSRPVVGVGSADVSVEACWFSCACSS